MNSKIRRLAMGLLVCYVALFVQLNLIQASPRQAELAVHPRNDRQTLRDFNRPRGAIVTADGQVAARSVPTIAPDARFDYQREYPLGDLFANVTGYYSFNYGSTQIERTQSELLAGKTPEQQLQGLGDILEGTDNTGSVVLTMRADLQQRAKELLGEREGSIVVLEPSTGKVLAMYSWPSYDPNLVATHDSDAAGAVLEYLNGFPSKPLLANAYQERYMPGSAFKVITTGIALEAGITSFDRSWPQETEWVPPQTNDPIQNYDGASCGGTMIEVFFRSCNIPFAQFAVELGPETMVTGTRLWGIGERLPIDLPAPVSSFFGEPTFFADNLPLLAIGGFGQGDDLMVPLHMAMVAGTVANGGRMMEPYVVDTTRYRDGNVLDRTEPAVWKTPISPTTADTLTTLMTGVVNEGTGRSMQLANGVQAAGKTGTAQLNAAGEPERSHAWIIGFAPTVAPRYAVAVMLRGTTDEISASTGGRIAGPIAKDLLDFLFTTDGLP